MSAEPELVTVYRSADPSALEDARDVHELLEEAGLNPVTLGDDQPGVPSGACEVRVPPEQVRQAESAIADAQETTPEQGDPGRGLDLETIFTAVGATAEVEALSIRTVLEANNIPTVYVSPPQYPNLRFVVQVPKRFFSEAKRVLAEAEAAGPKAAEEAEKESEG